jgi:hypothetical protein
MREDGAELRLVRRACSRLHLDQIRPHGLVTDLLIDRFRKPIQTWKQCRKANIHIFKVAGERNAPSQ